MINGKKKEVMPSSQVTKLTVIDIRLNIQSKCKRWRKEKEVIELLTDAKTGYRKLDEEAASPPLLPIRKKWVWVVQGS